MANVIGQLLVELGVNTAYMQAGFEQATYMAKKFGREVEGTFRELGKSTSELAAAFGVLGPAGAELAGAINLAGQAAGKMIKEFAGVSNTFGFAAAGAAGVTAAFASISVASIGMATHTAEQIKQMAESAQIAGMTTEEFSRFSFAAKQSGVSQEAFTSSMSRFGAKMAQAAQGNQRIQAEFKSMGVSVTDADGKMRKMGDVLLDVSDWFAKTADGAAKNNAAMQIGGRGFKQMLPLLNEGREGFKKWADESDAFGTTIDKNTAEMATKYTQTLTSIKQAGEGLSISLMKQLLPSLQEVATGIKEDLKSPDSDIRKLVSGIGDIAKMFVFLAAIAAAALGEIGQWFQKIGAEAVLFWDGLGSAAQKAIHGDFKGAVADLNSLKSAVDANDEQFAAKSMERWKKVWAVWQGGEGENKKPKGPGEEVKPPDLSKSGIGKQSDDTAKWIRHMQEAGAAARDMALGVEQSVAAIELHAAAVKADEEVDKRIADLMQKNSEIQKQIEEDKATETGGDKRKEEEWKSLQVSNNKQIAELKRFRDAYRSIKEEEVADAAIATAKKSLAQKGVDISAEITNQQALADAIKKGGESVYIAEATEKLKGEAKALELARQKAAEFASQNPKATEAIKEQNAALVEQQAAYDADLKSEENLLKVNFQKKVDDETRALQQETDAIIAQANALRLTAEQRNAVKASEAAAKFKEKNPEADVTQVNAVYAATLAKGQAEIYASEQAKANQLDVLHSYQEEKKVLDDIIANQNNSIGVRKSAEIEEYQNTQKMRAALDDMWMKSNSISDVMLGWADKLAAELPKLANDLGNDMVKAVDQFNSALINAIGTGKISFHSLLTSIAKDFATTALKGTEGLIASLATGQGASGQGKGAGGILAGLFGGGKGGERGTPTNPMITQDVSGTNPLSPDDMKAASLGDTGGATSGGSDAGPGGLSGLFSGLFGKLSGMLGGLFSSIGGIFSKLLGGLGGMFGGFLASGGDVTPGKAYVVGEHHPEFFVPRASGHVAPTMRTADAPKTYVSNVHFHGVTDADSFRRSQSQVMQSVGFGMSAALGRK